MDTQIMALIGAMVGVNAYLVIGVFLFDLPESVLTTIIVGLVGGFLTAVYGHFLERT